MSLQQPPDIHGICTCVHCEPKGRNPLHPSWYWCAVRGKQIAPRIDCGEQCKSFDPKTQHGGTEDMPKSKVDWDGPAEEYIDDAGEQPLWEYCRDMIEHGPKGTGAKLAERLGVAWNTMTSAIQRREQRENSSEPVAAAEPVSVPVAQLAPEPTPEPATIAPPEPVNCTPAPEPVADVVYQAPEVAAPSDPREHVDLNFEPAVVREFLIAMGMGQLFAGFALARDLDRRRAG